MLLFRFFSLMLFIVASLSLRGQQNDTIDRSPTQTRPLQRSRPVPQKPAVIIQDSNRLQVKDTLRVADSSRKDSLQRTPVIISKPFDPQYNRLLSNHPYLPLKKPAIFQIASPKVYRPKDELFYAVAALLFFLAISRLIFSKYFRNIFRLFFQPSFRQKQTREQLLQSNLPSLIFNLFFIASSAVYVALLLQYFHLLNFSFWVLIGYCAALITTLYVAKYLFITFSGWVFNVKEAADTYIFIVYLINKIVGVLLVPFILVIAFSSAWLVSFCITISFLVLVSLFGYRYIVSYAPIRKEVKVSPIHFIFYICAFEIVPLLLIYKVLVLYLARTL